MSTLTKSKKLAGKPVARRLAAKKVVLEKELWALGGTRKLPLAKGTAADLLRSLKDGSFDAAAAKGDWHIVENNVKNRSSSRLLRAAS